MIWDLLYSVQSRRAVDVTERFIDGHASRESDRHASYMAEVPTFGIELDYWDWIKSGPAGPIPPDLWRLIELGAFTEQQLRLQLR